MAALAAMAMPAAASGQTTSGPHVVTASATVAAQLSATVDQPLNFGTNIASNAGSVQYRPNGGANTAGINGQTFGRVSISHNSAFSTSASAGTTLASGANTLPVTFYCAYHDGAGYVGTTSTCGTLADRAVAAPGTTQTTELHVGGDITVSGAVPGLYTGSITFNFTQITS